MKLLVSINILLWMAGLLLQTNTNLHAQSIAFDPLLDPQCKLHPIEQTEKWNSSYMWYPGQLSAHMQKQHKQKSEARCVHVGYPGKFNQPLNQSYFRKTLRLQKETPIKWSGPKEITCYINNRKIGNEVREYVLSTGKNELRFEVQTTDRLPCLIVEGGNVSELTGWEVSLDNSNWNRPETYYTYNKPGNLPDSEQEIITDIYPDKYILLRNSSHQDELLSIGKNGSAIIDFRHLEVGTVKLNVTGKGTLTFRVGESPEEVLNENKGKNMIDFEQMPIPPFILTGSAQEISLPEMALRYLKITSEHPCQISSIRFEANIWPVDYLMQFESSDEGLNNLWKAASASLHTSMHNFYLDGVKRDYLPWSMDAVLSAFAGDFLFGDEQVSRNGLSIALMPPKPTISDFGIIDYPLHALIGFKQNYLRYGDLNTSLLYKDRIIQLLELYSSLQDEKGFFSAKDFSAGFTPGWSTQMGPNNNGTASYGQIMLYLNYVEGAYFARLWNEKALARKYDQKAEILRKNILLYFWDENQKAFINGYYANGEKDTRISHHAQYWAILADLFPTQHYDHLFDTILPEIKYYKETISYEKGYEFLAYLKAGRIKDMFALLHLIWGDWLEQGYTRFPENFSPYAPLKKQLEFYGRPFGLSLCHGANGVPPVVAVLHGIFGFSQSDKNISEYYLTPQLMDLSWAKGRIPVKEGFINIRIQKDGMSRIEIPENCIVHLCKYGVDKPLKTLKKASHYEFYYSDL